MNKETGAVLGYCAATVLTFGYNFRNRGRGKKSVLVSLIWAAVRPLYWPVTHTVSAILKIIFGVVVEIIQSILYHIHNILQSRGDIILSIYAAMALLLGTIRLTYHGP
jgi:hypothetical protein